MGEITPRGWYIFLLSFEPEYRCNNCHRNPVLVFPTSVRNLVFCVHFCKSACLCVEPGWHISPLYGSSLPPLIDPSSLVCVPETAVGVYYDTFLKFCIRSMSFITSSPNYIASYLRTSSYLLTVNKHEIFASGREVRLQDLV